MGIFDFVIDAGKDLFGSDEDKAAEIQKVIEDELEDFVSDLEVTYSKGVVTLSGYAETEEMQQRAIELAGDFKGVKEVNADDFEVEDSEEEEDDDDDDRPGPKPSSGSATTYTVKSGDTLSKIAKDFYGDASKYKKIFEANKDILKDPNMIKVGQVLKIPK
jgi:nucleoid-associated protein YgaU